MKVRPASNKKIAIAIIMPLVFTCGFFFTQLAVKPDYYADSMLFLVAALAVSILILIASGSEEKKNKYGITIVAQDTAVTENVATEPILASPAKRESVKEIHSDITRIDSVASDIEADTKKQSESIEAVQAAIESIKFYIDSIYGKMDSHDAVINETSANLEKIVSFIDTISDLSATASGQTDELVMVTGLLTGSMTDLFTSMDKIDATSKLVKNLMSIIEEIAEKTNLISINASIEAAHARTEGKGFKVISAEIRKLSTNTKNQVREINQLITDILEKINESGAKRKEAKTNLETMNSSIEKVKIKMDDMHKESNKQRELNGKILEGIVVLKSNNEDLKQDISEGYESSAEVISITNSSIEALQRVYGSSKNLKTGIISLIQKLDKLDGRE
jgi:methyl-accepting chemotaxis protein